jgi:hypothetical protein
LSHEALSALADEHEKTRQFSIADLVLLLSSERQTRDALVAEKLVLISHGGTTLVWV